MDKAIVDLLSDLLKNDECVEEFRYDEDDKRICVWTCDSPDDQYDHSELSSGVLEVMDNHGLELTWNDCPGGYNEGVIS